MQAFVLSVRLPKVLVGRFGLNLWAAPLGFVPAGVVLVSQVAAAQRVGWSLEDQASGLRR